MIRRIWLDNERFVSCDVDNYGDKDVYLFSGSVDLDEVVEAMDNNGFRITGIHRDDAAISVDRTKFFFDGDSCYTLKQCSDIFDWFGEATLYEFTYYYDRIVFRTPTGFCAAYIEDTNNFTRI